MNNSMLPKKSLTNAVQRKYLRDRVSAVYWRGVHRDGELPAPANVKAARKVVRAFEEVLRKRRAASDSIFERAKKKALEDILFSSPEAALASVQAFERLKAK